MWTTLDGHRLMLGRETAARIITDPERWEIRELLRVHHGGDMKQAIDRTMRELASTAARDGQFRGPASGRVFPVFNATARGVNYCILTRPAGPGRSWIVAIRRGPLDRLVDFYVAKYKGQAKVDWKGPTAATAWNASQHAYPGVYRIDRGGKAMYVGESKNVGSEVAHYLNILRKVVPIGQFRVWAGKTQGKRGMVEHTLIRQGNRVFGSRDTYAKKGSKLRNRSSIAPFEVTGRMDISHTGNVPPGVSNVRVGKGTYEFVG